jgi:polyhydroxybutyrate depolymerase
MPKFTRFNDLADEAGFIVAYPESLNQHWNDGRNLSSADDIGFVRALLADVQRFPGLDPKRIYATGISNGGFFSQRVACELADQVAAVASIAATIPEPLMPGCKPVTPVPVMFIQGTRDPLVPIDGGPIGRNHGKCIALTAAVDFWRRVNHVSSIPIVTELPDDAHDGTRIHRAVYGQGQHGTEVVVYTIEGGGHTWPGGPQYLPTFLVGKVSHNLNATQVVWDFFSRHRLQ